MSNLKDVLIDLGGGDALASGLFLLVFALVFITSLNALINLLRLELETRKTFNHRTLLLQGYFAQYGKRVHELEEEVRRREEAIKARMAEG